MPKGTLGPGPTSRKEGWQEDHLHGPDTLILNDSNCLYKQEPGKEIFVLPTHTSICPRSGAGEDE